MDLPLFFKDKHLKPKERTGALAQMLLAGDLDPRELIAYAAQAKDPEKATCMEAFEFATRADSKIASGQLLAFATENLASKAPRVKWESAKVIGNMAHLYPKKLDKAIAGLLINSEDKGTVVRWAAAFALGEIVKLKTAHNKALLPAIKAIVAREEKNSIQKIYLAAVKGLDQAS